jgi:elongation factor Ts
LVEINCETDFVARNENFQAFCQDVAMQIAATNPRFLNRESVPAEVIEKEKEILKEQLRAQGKPEAVWEKILVGKVDKFYQENCLLEQAFVKDTDRSIHEYLKETISKIGENIVIARYSRFELGQSDA